MEHLQTLSKTDRELVRKIVDIITSDLSMHYSIPDLAEMVWVNRSKLQRLFMMAYGKGPYEYLSDLRLEKAQDLLLAGVSLKQISVKIGFSGELSEANFIRFFKKKTGFTPGSWKKSQIKMTG